MISVTHDDDCHDSGQEYLSASSVQRSLDNDCVAILQCKVATLEYMSEGCQEYGMGWEHRLWEA